MSVVVTKAATTIRHSQHMCLFFNPSDLFVCLYRSDIASGLTKQISFVLNLFLIKYAKELKVSAPENYLSDEEDIVAKFAKVFALVRSCDLTLFVAVDDYDAPTRTLTLHVDHPVRGKPFATPREIENLLDSCFWKPLMDASDVIDKLWATGAVLVNYLTLGRRTTGSFQRSTVFCGFTEEALYFMQALLDETPNITDLRHWCGNYNFSSPTVAGQSLLHPRLLINWIFDLSLPDPPVDEDSFELLSRILGFLLEESAAPEAVTVNSLIELLATGAVDVGGQSAFPFELAVTKRVTWSDLHFAGALTYGPSEGTLRIANHRIHSRVDSIFNGRHELGFTFTTAWFHFSMSGDPEPVLKLLSRVLCDLTRRSLDRKREPNLHGIFELVMRNSHCYGQEFDPIVSQSTASVDCIQVPAYQPEKNFTLELKTITLRGMWQAANPNDNEPPIEALKVLHGELVNLKKDELLARPYTAWSPTLNVMETVHVGSFFDSEPSANPRFLAVGGAQVLLREPPRQDIAEDAEENIGEDWD
ncbi:hypothetical protein K438DRAFT_1954800 [Mycena galopus ATCC 62051]|nr:hypothetical protein K438DRAFT_1954800 [Mycena galopus ATCC 62051]